MTLNVWDWEKVVLPFAAEEDDLEVVERVLAWIDQVSEDPESVVFSRVPGRNARVSPIPGTEWTMTWGYYVAPLRGVKLWALKRRDESLGPNP